MGRHENPNLDDLHDLSLAYKGYLTEVKDWYAFQLLSSKHQEQHPLTLQ